MTDNKTQSATCRGSCGRCRLDSHTRGKGDRRSGALMGLGSCPAAAACRGTPWSRRGVEF